MIGVDVLCCPPIIISNVQNCFPIISLLQFSGPEASVSILTDFICAAQMAREEDQYLPEDDLKVNFLIYLMYISIKVEMTFLQVTPVFHFLLNSCC